MFMSHWRCICIHWKNVPLDERQASIDERYSSYKRDHAIASQRGMFVKIGSILKFASGRGDVGMVREATRLSPFSNHPNVYSNLGHCP